MHNQESTLNDVNPDDRYLIAEAVWAAGGYVRWNEATPNSINVMGTADNFQGILNAVNSVIHGEVAGEPLPT